ncbi:protein DEK isoform X2 [Eucalyptus grandis]|uniref:protein DEK isoform X2 n=1 Tax=Eucalyptus grandis TaxID=71139 RepID=UPI00192E7691|nr:protein DEK isoform X2 [Eucalyptus grandis]
MASGALAETAEPGGAAPVDGKEEPAEKPEDEPEEAEREKEPEIASEAEASDEKADDEEDGDGDGDGDDDGPEEKGSEENAKGSSAEEEASGRKRSRRSRGGLAGKRNPATPGVERPTRERRSVERYSAPALARTPSSKGFSIEKGRGTQLKDIPNVAFKLSKRKPDDNLQILHAILFGKKAKVHSLKRNIGQFSGYVWTENQEKQRSKVKEKLDKCVKDKLIDFCDVLNIPINKAAVKKEELSAKLLEFLESPHSTTDVLLADKEQGQKRKRKITPSKPLVPGEASSTMTEKRQKQAPDSVKKSSEIASEEDDDDDKGDSKEVKDNSDANSDDDMVSKEESGDEKSKSEEEDMQEEPALKSSSRKKTKESSVSKTKDTSVSAKKVTPAKSAKKSSTSASKKSSVDGVGNKKPLSKSEGSKSKKQKVEKSNQNDQSVSSKAKTSSKKQSAKPSTEASVKDRVGKGKSSKKAKAEPSREEMHAVVVDILKKVDFNTATLSDILRQLGTHFGVDLMHRKAEIKDIITEVINNMTDDEDEGDDEEAEDKADADDNE